LATPGEACACGYSGDCCGLTAQRRSWRLDVDDFLTSLNGSRTAARLPFFQAIEQAAVELSPHC
jgi:hypothetical protein